MIEESWDTQLYMHSESDSFDRPISEAKPLALGDRREWWHQIVRKIRRPLDLEKICQQTVDELGKAFDISRCIICLYKSGDHQVSVVAEYRQEPFHSLLGKFLEVGEEPGFSEALASLEPVVVQLTRTDQDRCEQQSILVIATYDRDRPNGIISLQHCLSDSFPCPIGETKPLALGDRQWSEEQIELVRELGDVVGSAIAHVQLYKKWEEASYQAQEASRLKNEFLGTISHELRTPLNKIICSLKLILDDGADDPEEQREFINYAHHSALHLLNLINDILEISKLKSDKSSEKL